MNALESSESWNAFESWLINCSSGTFLSIVVVAATRLIRGKLGRFLAAWPELVLRLLCQGICHPSAVLVLVHFPNESINNMKCLYFKMVPPPREYTEKHEFHK